MENIKPSAFKIDADYWPPLLAQVNAETVGTYARFRQSLTPRYAIVWRDIAFGYVGLSLILYGLSNISGALPGLAAAALGAAAIGFVIAYLQLFIHEAAHYNLAQRRGTSDLLANALIAWQVGTSIAAYRRVHFEHHRHLGHDDDGERSYVHQLSWKLLAEMLTGVHALRIFLARAKAPPPSSNKGDKATKSLVPLARGVAVHGLLLCGLALAGAWPAILAWIGGMAIFFPFFATLRPLLEHRPTSTDEQRLNGPREAVTRMFDDGIFARVFGGAGFNRHLLHHWEPQVSYTRLRELDDYLCRTSVGSIIEARRTTYGQAFRDILANDRGR